MSSADTQPALSARTGDGQARQRALASLPHSLSAGPEGGDTVTYRSAGRAVVVGPAEAAAAAADRLRDSLDVYVLVTDGAGDDIEHPDIGTLGARALRARRIATRGYLGDFHITVQSRRGETDLAAKFGFASSEGFDIVLDLDEPAGLPQQKPPPGYFAPADALALDAAISEMAELLGEFEKPRFFEYRDELCAHGARGQTGCSRCLEACATGAIRGRPGRGRPVPVSGLRQLRDGLSFRGDHLRLAIGGNGRRCTAPPAASVSRRRGQASHRAVPRQRDRRHHAF